MADAQRRAEVVWTGSLAKGEGRMSLVSSGVAADLPVTWASRTARSDGKTSPEELMAGAHAACYSMALAHILTEDGHEPDTLEVSATVTFAQTDGGFRLQGSALHVRGRVPGIGREEFLKAAEDARAGCPVSGALKGNVEITLAADLAE
jgi:osmotically inducible protein OsmC